MGKVITSLGLMSGTSMDGVDISLINSDGRSIFEVIKNSYYEYPSKLYSNLTKLREIINLPSDIEKNINNLKLLEREITLFHAEAVNKFNKKNKIEIEIVGFHGQTMLHNPDEQITYQIGDPYLLSQLIKKKIIYNFRNNDIKNGGDGAPLTPIFHKLLYDKYKLTNGLNINYDKVIFLNIGGISNLTIVKKSSLISWDCGPGMCLIDKFLRSSSRYKIDKDGQLAKKGIINKYILNEMLNHLDNILLKSKRRSLDINDFNLNIVRGLKLNDAMATLTELTAKNIANQINSISSKKSLLLLCGGGRKNATLRDSIKNQLQKKIDLKLVDDYSIDGDFVESQAFAYLSIRSKLRLAITFPRTTGCKKPCTGGKQVKNY
ncbi:MAG: anhydro-N-acetylmuramic acid kinase [Candidatus Pelagibacter sp. TMED118]|nr:MAG: anhydro-N-acetylmuramic acid kinase [Candidatus Pelagibacter sp. TMED118]|tara:strand:- start:4872 stop:6002 length:1131 start_codon:yes stop_codon:yes gene_type:complete